MSLRDDLDRWVQAGLLSQGQAAGVLTFEQQRHATAAATGAVPPRRRVPPVAEALGYLGGVLGIVGLVLLIARSWSDLPTFGRLGLAGAGTAAFVVGGAIVREEADPALARLRWFLWLIATGAAGVFGATLERSIADIDDDTRTALVAAVAVTVISFALRGSRRRPVQHLTLLAGAVVTIGTLLAHLGDQSAGGIAVWSTGVLLVVASLRDGENEPVITAAVGGVAAVVGPLLMLDRWNAIALLGVVVTGAALVALAATRGAVALRGQRIVMTVLGVFALVQGVPSAIGYFASDAGVITGMVVWAIGWLLVIAATRPEVRSPIALTIVGGVGSLVGPAVTATESTALATTLGLLTAVALLAVGTRPGRVLVSVVGSVGLLVYVPWTIAHFFPGQARAPLLILVSGVMIAVVAVLLARLSGRFRRELRGADSTVDRPAPAASDGPQPA